MEHIVGTLNAPISSWVFGERILGPRLECGSYFSELRTPKYKEKKDWWLMKKIIVLFTLWVLIVQTVETTRCLYFIIGREHHSISKENNFPLKSNDGYSEGGREMEKGMNQTQYHSSSYCKYKNRSMVVSCM